jgi:hypothetical protein
MNILDSRFKYIPAAATNIEETWKKHGWKKTTDAERRARQKKSEPPVAQVHVLQRRQA